MFLSEPPATNYDLHFNVFGFPVRVHPFFWLAAVVLGASGATGNDAVIQLMIWILVLFVSILVHELGHAFAMRFYGQPARIVLYMMGGLAIPDRDSPWSMGSSPWQPMSQFGNSGRGSSNRTAHAPLSRIVIAFAGPAAGFCLAAVVIGVGMLMQWGAFEFRFQNLPYFFVWIANVPNAYLNSAIAIALYINIFWGLVNLLPIFPLDGGQISRELFQQSDPWNGVLKSLWLSVVAAAVVAVWGLSQQSMFLAIMFGMLAFSSYTAIQQIGGGGFGPRW